MKSCIFIHAKSTSNRIPYKNLQILGNETLVGRMSRICADTGIDTFVDSDALHISDIIDPRASFISRPSSLANNDTDGNKLLLWAANTIDNYDIYLQINCCCPFLTSKTILKCEYQLLIGNYDSVTTVKPITEYLWFDNEPMYDIYNLPNSVDLKPLYAETHGVYGITKKLLLETKCRVWNPFLLEIKPPEDLDINTIEDLEKARNIYVSYTK